MYHVHIPEAEEQTDVRRASLYWITSMGTNKAPRLAAWLLRSEHNPYNPGWRGVEIEARPGEDPASKIFHATETTLGIAPRYVDLVGVLQPGDHPDINHTTFVYTGFDRAPNDPNTRTLPKPVVGLALGMFALDGLPASEMRASDAALIPDMLAAAVERGMSPYRVEYVPGELPSAGVIIR